jgi:hypothetical protein
MKNSCKFSGTINSQASDDLFTVTFKSNSHPTTILELKQGAARHWSRAERENNAAKRMVKEALLTPGLPDYAG